MPRGSRAPRRRLMAARVELLEAAHQRVERPVDDRLWEGEGECERSARLRGRWRPERAGQARARAEPRARRAGVRRAGGCAARSGAARAPARAAASAWRPRQADPPPSCRSGSARRASTRAAGGLVRDDGLGQPSLLAAAGASAADCWIWGVEGGSGGNCISAFCRASMFCGRVATRRPSAQLARLLVVLEDLGTARRLGQRGDSRKQATVTASICATRRTRRRRAPRSCRRRRRAERRRPSWFGPSGLPTCTHTLAIPSSSTRGTRRTPP